MMRTLMLNDMHRNLGKLLDIQQQLATERKYQHASQNPHAVTKGMGLETMMTEGKQYVSNLQDAVSWLKFTDEAFSGMNDLFNRIRELAVKGGDGSLESVDRMAIATELRELKAALMSIANSTIAGNYLFSGMKTDTIPFTIGPNGQVVYNGNNYALNWEFARLQTGKVSITGREVFPLEETSHKLKGIEVPLDFEWSGRGEILEFKVGWRTVKVRIPERWTDEIANGLTDPGDYNRFRDPGEPLEGWSLDEIAHLINNSKEMGDASKLIKATVVKDLDRGVQYLQIQSLTGEPVRLTGWPETDPVKASQGIKGAAYGAFDRKAASDGKVEIRFGDNQLYTVNVTKGETLEDIAKALNALPEARIWAAYKSDGENEWIDVVARNPEDYFNLSTTGGATQLFATEMATVLSEKEGGNQVVKSNEFNTGFDLITAYGGKLTIRQGYDVFTLDVPARSDLADITGALSDWIPPLPPDFTISISADGNYLEITTQGDEFSVTAEGGLAPLFSDGAHNSSSSVANSSGKFTFDTNPLPKKDAGDDFALVTENSAFSIEYNGQKYWFDLSTSAMPSPASLDQVAEHLQDFITQIPDLEGTNITVRRDLDEFGNEIQWLRVESDKQIKLSGFGNAADVLGHFIVGSKPIYDNFDHTHIGFADMMQMTTSLTSKEIPVSAAGWDTTENPPPNGNGNGAVHLNFVSGNRHGEVFIADSAGLSLEDLAARINSVCGDWLQAIVQIDQPDGVNPIIDPLNNSGDNAENATKRLVLRTIDGEPFAVYDGLGKPGTPPIVAGSYASMLGLNTSLAITNRPLWDNGQIPGYPHGFPVGEGVFDENMPAILKVTVGCREFEVKVCKTNCPNGKLVAEAIVRQVNEQYGGTLLSLGESVNPEFDPLNPYVNPSSFSIFAVTGEPLRIFDASYGDPRFREYTGGIAAQLGINAGLTSLPMDPSFTTFEEGLIRIRTPGYSVDVPILPGEDMLTVANRIRDYAGTWLDVSFSAAKIPNPPPPAHADPINGIISIAAKDGSAVSMYDINGDAAKEMNLDTGLVSKTVGDWNEVFSGLVPDGDGNSPTLSITVNGATLTIDLWDANAQTALTPTGKPTVNTVEELAEMINVRFQGQDIRAEVLTDSSDGSKRLALWSPKGYNFEITGTGAYEDAAGLTLLPEALGFTPEPPGNVCKSNDRGLPGNQPFNQVVTQRTGNNTYDIDFFGVLDNLINTVEGGDVDGISDTMLSQLDNWLSTLLKCRATDGALINRYEAAVYRMTTNNTNYTDLYTQTVGVDLAETITDFEMASNIYQASLAAIARLLQPSLLDFLR